tara:strand:- start:698 stop:982 length:285 start_codon:yes stop_codon:yes gene_type:complete
LLTSRLSPSFPRHSAILSQSTLSQHASPCSRAIFGIKNNTDNHKSTNKYIIYPDFLTYPSNQYITQHHPNPQPTIKNLSPIAPIERLAPKISTP